MTDDLVARLRIGIHISVDEQALRNEAADRIEQLTGELNKAVKLGKAGGYKATPEHSWAEWCDELYRDLNKANERIEQLEAALRKIAGGKTYADDPWSIARAALEGKRDG